MALIPETLVVLWALMPLYVNGFGNRQFFIAYSGDPPDPDGRRFWRIRADRSPDSDGDGVPDWLEFFLAAGPAGDSMADAFVGDTDNGGVKDG